MRRVAIVLAVLLLLPLQAAGQSSPPSPTCIGESEAIHVAGFATRAESFLIVDLTLSNRSSGPIRVDPSRITLETARGYTASPMSEDEVKSSIGSIGAHIVGLAFLGPVGLILSGASAVRINREISAKILRAGELPSRQPISKSVYFKVPDTPMSRVAITIGGLTPASGEPVPAIRLQCAVRKIEQNAEPQAPRPLMTVHTVSPSAQGTAGIVRAAVSVVEFWPDVTMVELTLVSTAGADANVFSALANATLTDQAGKTVGAKLIRSEFPDRIPARGTVTAKLAFEPLPAPPQTQSLTLVIPGIQVGQQTFETRVQFRVQF